MNLVNCHCNSVGGMVIAALSLAGCSAPPAEVHTRVTVEVQTPQGVRSGSSVWSRRIWAPTVALASTYSTEFRGEAVAVDLPGGRTLFALVKDQAAVAERHFADLGPTGLARDRVANVRAIAKRVGETRQLPCEPVPEGLSVALRADPRYDCPLLVTFGDIADPKSVARVDPADLATTFGPGVTLRRISVAVTDDPVTTGIEKRFPWWENYRDRWFDGTSTVSQDMTTDRLSASLSAGSFSTEFNR